MTDFAAIASRQKIGMPAATASGTVIVPEFKDGQGRLVAYRPHQSPVFISGDLAPVIDTLGNASTSSVGEEVVYATAEGAAVVRLGERPRLELRGALAVPRLSRGGGHLAALSYSAPGAELVVRERATGQTHHLRLSSGWVPLEFEWLPEGRRAVIAEMRPDRMPWDDGQLTLVDTISGELKVLVAACPGRHTGSPRPAPDGNGVAFISDRGGWLNLWWAPLAGGAPRPLLNQPREHLHPAFSPSGATLAYVSRRAGDYRLRLLELASGTEVKLHDVPGVHGSWLGVPGQSLAWGPSDSIATSFSTPGTPPEALLVRQQGEDSTLTRNSISDRLVESSHDVHWHRAGLELQAWLHLPANPMGDPPPLAVHVHGGPVGDGALWWLHIMAGMLADGWVVLDVNHRGSVGFGREFQDALIGGWGEADVADVAAGVEAARSQFALDRRTCIFGVSAGGYAAAMGCLLHPELYFAGVCGSGVYDLTRISEETNPAQRFYIQSLFGERAADVGLLAARSPVLRALEIQRPLLIWQGEDSIATPRAQADRFAAALTAAGRPHRYELIPQEAYGGTYACRTQRILELTSEFLRQALPPG